jgi:ketosteroid isomerase-like protein
MRTLVGVALLATLACNADAPADAPPLPAVALPAELDRVLREYEGAYARRDANALAELFAEDGFLLQPGRPPVRGRRAIAAALQGEGGALALVPIAYRMSDSAGYIIGTFGAERAADEGGKFVLALERRAAGPWRIAADMANPNRP